MADEVVGFNFQAGGIREVQRAFSTIEQSVMHLERASIASANREAMARISASHKVAEARTKAEEKIHKQLSKAEAEALGKTVVTANARAEVAKREADKRLEASLAMYRALDDLEKKHTEHTQAEARKRAASDKAAHDAAVTRRKQWASTIMGAAGGSLRSSIGTIAQYGGAALGIAGGLSVGSAVQRGMSAEASSIGLANSMYNPNDAAQRAFLTDPKNAAYITRGRFNSGALHDFAKATQASSGIDKNELLGGMQAYIAKSSDWGSMSSEKGKAMHMELARLAKATGTSYGNVMNTAGSLKSQNQNLTSDQMMEMLYAIVGQGKSGAIEMSDVAKYGSTITSSAGSYAGSQAVAQKRLLGLVQVAGRVSSSPADAATGVARFAADVAKHAKENQAAHPGMKVMDDKGNLFAPSQIMSEYFRVTGGNTTKMGERKGNLGLGMESIKVALGSKGVYSAALEDAKAGVVNKEILRNLGLGEGKRKFTDSEANLIGAEAVRLDIKKLEDAGYDKTTIDRDHAEVMAAHTERFQKVMMALSESIERRALPFLEKLSAAFEKHAPQVDKFIDAVADVAEFLTENPFLGIGGIIAGKVALDIGAAAIGEVAGTALAGALGSAAAAGIIAPLVGAALAGILAAAATKIVIDSAFEAQNEKDSATIKASMDAHEVNAAYKRKVDAGTNTAEDDAEFDRKTKEFFQATYGPEGLVTNRTETGALEDIFGFIQKLGEVARVANALTPEGRAAGATVAEEEGKTALDPDSAASVHALKQANRDAKALAMQAEHNRAVELQQQRHNAQMLLEEKRRTAVVELAMGTIGGRVPAPSRKDPLHP